MISIKVSHIVPAWCEIVFEQRQKTVSFLANFLRAKNSTYNIISSEVSDIAAVKIFPRPETIRPTIFFRDPWHFFPHKKIRGKAQVGKRRKRGKRVYPDFLLWAIPPSHSHEKEERGCWKWWHPYHTSSYSKVHLPTHACILRIIYPTSHGRRGLHHKREGLGKFFVFLKATTSLRRFQKKPCTTEKRPVPMFVVSKLVIKSTDLPSYPALFFSHRKKNMWQKSGVFAGRK